MHSLRLPLKMNGAFSLLSGILLFLAPGSVNDWLGLEATVVIRLFGVVLLGHGLLLFWSASRPSPQPFVLMNLVAIAPYPLAMIALVATGLVESATGRMLVLADGAIIGAIAMWHWRTLREHRHSPAVVPA